MGILVTDLCEYHHIRIPDITGIVIGSVVPPLTGTMSAMAVKYFGHMPLVFEPAMNGGMPNLYANPAEVGADRIVNAIAACARYGSVAPSSSWTSGRPRRSMRSPRRERTWAA
jgi:type III pantothenate kinase